MPLKHRPNTEMPNLSLAEGRGNKNVFDQMMRLLQTTFLNIYDDLNATKVNKVVYFGDEATQGTWRMIVSGNNLSVQRYEAGAWVEKTAFTP